MICILASNNKNKARELRAFFEGNCTLLTLADIGVSFTAGEDRGTFIGNAEQKARETAAFLRDAKKKGTVNLPDAYAVFADDSGLVIDALDGEPGVDSALYLGADTPFDIRNADILRRMEGLPLEKRTARFVCVLAAVMPENECVNAVGTLEGFIHTAAAGDGGFGYDPIFYLPDFDKTMAQLTTEEKNSISHRGKAMVALMRIMEQYTWKS